jgi:flavin reductase (DIM6/NTAB) family NADH-FMN oxidoreductase RutF
MRVFRETRHFVVNIMGMPSFDKAMKIAKNHPPEVDELEAVVLVVLPRPPLCSWRAS